MTHRLARRTTLALLTALACVAACPAHAQDDARTRQLRVLCAQLSGDLTDPGGMAAFRRCLTTQNPTGEIARDNNIPAPTSDRPAAKPPAGFGQTSRTIIANGIDSFATSDPTQFLAVDSTAKLWRFNPQTKAAQALADRVASSEPVGTGGVLILGTDGKLWRGAEADPARTLVDDHVSAFKPLGRFVYVLGTDAKLWREAGSSARRELIDSNVVAFQPADDTLVLVLSADGTLWRQRGDARDRTQVAAGIAAFDYLAASETVHVLVRDGTLWRQAGATGKPEQIDHAVAAFRAVTPHLIYVLGKDGRLWLDHGSSDQADLVDTSVLTTAGRAAFTVTDAQHITVLGADHKLWAETMPAYP
jgi:hypothetical protein